MYQSESAPWLWFRAWATDGSAKTDLVFNTSGISIKVARDNQADSSALSLSAASGPTDWAAGKFLQVVGNLYKVGIATASISSYTGAIAICGSYTGGTIEGILDYVSAYDPTKNPLSPLVAGRQIAVSATTGKVTAEAVELDSAARLAIWNTLTTESFTADSFGDLLLISDGTNGREVKVTGANHIAADVHDVQPDGLSGSTEITNIENASGYLLAIQAGACADPQTASETYAITIFGSTFTVDMAGQTSTGTRTAPTLTKS